MIAIGDEVHLTSHPNLHGEVVAVDDANQVLVSFWLAPSLKEIRTERWVKLKFLSKVTR